MSDILLQAVQTLCDPLTLFCMALAMAYGILLGAIPGLTATMAVALMAIAPPLANFAVTFGSYEYAALACFALSMVSSLSEKDRLRGLMSALLGLFSPVWGKAPLTVRGVSPSASLKWMPVLKSSPY